MPASREKGALNRTRNLAGNRAIKLEKLEKQAFMGSQCCYQLEIALKLAAWPKVEAGL